MTNRIMSNQHDIDASIADTIQDELTLFSQLHDVLLQQQQQLINRDTPALGETAQAILRLMGEARLKRQERSDYLGRIGIKNNELEMENYLCGLTTDFKQDLSKQDLNKQDLNKQDLNDNWQALTEVVETCKQINLDNGQILDLQQKMTDKILDRLENRQEKEISYSATGTTKRHTNSTLQLQA